MQICKEPESTFIHIPKTGGQSIRSWMQHNLDISGHTPSGTHPHETGENAIGYRFCVVRNPYERMLSMWKFLCSNSPMTFQEFLEGKFPDKFWYTPQVDFVANADLVLRFETLEQDFAQIQEFYGYGRPSGVVEEVVELGYVDAPLPQLNESHYEGTLEDYYDEITRNLVETNYADDFEQLSYNKLGE
jgi:hypothetical protein